MQVESRTSHTSTHSTTSTLIQNIAQLTTSFRTTTPTKDMTGRMNTVQPATSFRTTTPTKAMTGQQINPVWVSQDTPHKTHLESCMHVHQVHLENFQQLKMEISNVKALPYFNINAETTLQMDASKETLGACLIQNGKVVCYASRALTKTEQNYQNLE